MTSDHDAERIRAQRFGWASLLAWATLGFVLEAAHGFKVASYLDDELTRMLLRLGHAHGVGLSLVVLVYSVAGVPNFPIEPGRTPLSGRLLRLAAWLMPVGFTLSAWGHPEGDPSVVIVLVPIGALMLLTALSLIVRGLWQKSG